MQGKNKTQSTTPKSGDGTQDISKKKTDANWFGTSQEPQEEFIENGPRVEGAASTKMSGSDEGVPTFSGTKQPGTPERAADEDRRNTRGDGFDRDKQTTKRPTDIDNRH